MTKPLTYSVVRDAVAELLYQDPAEVTEDTNLLDSGLDSVRILSLVEQWRENGVEISFIDLAERPTLAQWWELLSSKLPNDDHA